MAFESLTEKLSNAFKKLRSKGKLTESDVKEAMREVRLALLEADVNFKVAKDFTNRVTEKAIGAEILESLTPGQQVVKLVNDELVELMGGAAARIAVPNHPPCIIMLCGLQGSGKTTHAGKLAYMMRKEGRHPLLVACDVYRPAAIEQLKVVGQKAGVEVFEMGQINPVKITQEALKYAKDHGNDTVIIDTAGRLHIDEALMNELKEVKAAVKPHEMMLVVDAMTGQDAVNVAKSFNEALGIDGVILTKCMASRILGMGDVLSLIEKAEQNLDEKNALELQQKLKTSTFDFNDLLAQFQQMRKMGPLKNLIGMIPGMSQQLGDVEIDDRMIDRIEAIIYSMTPREREKPDLLNASRKRRIAAGSGMKVEDVNRLVKQIEMMQKMFKQVGGKGGKGLRNMMRGMGGMNGMGRMKNKR